MANWVQVDDHVQEIAQEPWSMAWREWKSGSSEFNDFLMNPLPEIMKDFPLVQADWRVTSEIVNHERSLLGSAVCNTCIIMPDTKTVKLMFYKH